MTDGKPSNGPRLPVGFLIAGSEMASFTIVGLFLDYVCKTMPAFTIGLTLVGLFVAFFQLTRLAKALTGKKPPINDEQGRSTDEET